LPLGDIQGVFKEAIKNAKFTGKVLACALAMRFPFRAESISIVAFSLGC
jgi:hypothetical protein